MHGGVAAVQGSNDGERSRHAMAAWPGPPLLAASCSAVFSIKSTFWVPVPSLYGCVQLLTKVSVALSSIIEQLCFVVAMHAMASSCASFTLFIL